VPHAFDITVEASLKDSDLIHRIGQFKEDLYRECLHANATFSDIAALSRTLAPFTITVHSKSGLGPFTKALKKSLEQHDVAQAIRVSRR
jgi:hypothetical protein